MDTFTTTLDIVLIATSLAAVLYCWQLSRRLKALHDLKGGIGEAIVSLNAAITASREANEAIATAARTAISDCNTAIDRLAENRQLAEDVIENLDGQVHGARTKLSRTLKSAEEVAAQVGSLNERARLELNALNRAVDIASRVNGILRGQVRDRLRPTRARAPETGNVHELSAPKDERVRTEQNPFLHAVKTG
jgi:ABC-type transporter Mla subunit MlaD